MHTVFCALIAYLLFASQCFAAVTEFTQFHQWNGTEYVPSTRAPFVWDGSAYVEIGVGTPVTQLSDTFTGTNGTLLENHTSDSGHTWTQFSGTAGALQLLDGALVGGVATTAIYYSSFVPALGDYSVTGVLKAISTSTSAANPSIGGRYQLDSGYGYFVRLNASTGALQLYRLDSAPVILASYSMTVTLETEYTVTIVMNGDAISVKLGGTQVISPVTDATYSSGGAFVRSYATGTGTAVSMLSLSTEVL